MSDLENMDEADLIDECVDALESWTTQYMWIVWPLRHEDPNLSDRYFKEHLEHREELRTRVLASCDQLKKINSGHADRLRALYEQFSVAEEEMTRYVELYRKDREAYPKEVKRLLKNMSDFHDKLTEMYPIGG